MNYWIITDTHLGHDKLTKSGFRPEGFEKTILKNLNVIKREDVLIHIGDVCLSNDEYWNLKFAELDCTRWLVKGNHDNKTNGWYLAAGWHCVSNALTLEVFGKRILFTHVPCTAHNDFNLNIHGHLHNSNHRDIKGLTEKHKLLYLEHDYKPFNLRKIVEGR